MERRQLNRDRGLAAGFSLVLLFMLASSISPSFHLELTDALRSFSALLQTTPATLQLIFATLGTVLWLGQLRSFSARASSGAMHEGLLVLCTTGLGLGFGGFIAWLRWTAAESVDLGRMFVLLTLGSALFIKGLAWLLARGMVPAKGEPTGAAAGSGGSFRDYILLTKPVVLALLLVTTLAAMIVAAGGMPEPGLLAWTMLGGALSGGGASALNQYIDRNRDGKMARTKRRPLPDGRLHPNEAIIFGTLLCIGGFFSLAIFVNLLSALLALIGMIYYVIFYSMVLKPTTTQNIVIGGGAGAIPPLVGWAAAVGEINMPAFFLFALVFFWTPPHFWALALLKRRDYARAGVPMLPVVHGSNETRWQIMLYTVQVVALTLLLPLAQLGGQIYFIAALALGSGLVFYAWRLYRVGGNQPAYRMYRYSSTYLALIFAALVLDTFL
ncbi:MAG: heme o synthase [Anaerolineales bacterium]|nr:heme o synthase [Anaerolineales bacterium]